jgi:hypothetical protein
LSASGNPFSGAISEALRCVFCWPMRRREQSQALEINVFDGLLTVW